MGYKDPAQQAAYQLAWMNKRREAWFAANGPCRKCGSTENLELDHLNPRTKVHHAVWSWSRVRRDAELVKCQVLCRACHQIKSNYEKSQKTHGTGTMYRNGCKCDDCKTHQRLKARRYRAKLKAAGSPGW
jgi:5-methylcytosine-specific restriction endonuclease McrA